MITMPLIRRKKLLGSARQETAFPSLATIEPDQLIGADSTRLPFDRSSKGSKKEDLNRGHHFHFPLFTFVQQCKLLTCVASE